MTNKELQQAHAQSERRWGAAKMGVGALLGSSAVSHTVAGASLLTTSPTFSAINVGIGAAAGVGGYKLGKSGYKQYKKNSPASSTKKTPNKPKKNTGAFYYRTVKGKKQRVRRSKR